MHLGLEVSEMQSDSEITFVCMCNSIKLLAFWMFDVEAFSS